MITGDLPGNCYQLMAQDKNKEDFLLKYIHDIKYRFENLPESSLSVS
jgi:hypothetical protein